jgi:hypothetical protein
MGAPTKEKAMSELVERIEALEKRVEHFLPLPETKECECGKKMVRVRTGTALMTHPVRYRTMFWCKCGRKEDAGLEVAKSADDYFEELWLKANWEV